MPNHYFNIFRRIRDYFVSPHLNLWRRVRRRLFTSDFPDDAVLLQDFEVSPPPELFSQTIDTYRELQLSEHLGKLQEHTIAPPEASFENIMHLIKNKKKFKAGILRSMPTLQRVIAAASVLLVLGTAVWIWKKQSASEKEMATNTLPAKPADIRQPIPTLPDSVNVISNVAENKAVVSNRILPFKNRKVDVKMVEIDGIFIPIENNDILYSFAKYNAGSEINWKKGKSKFVKLDDYAGISISPFMSGVIADLYKTKKNGKPTYKARRAKAKINRWKRQDNRSFDKKKNRNPLDIIDLADHVY